MPTIHSNRGRVAAVTAAFLLMVTLLAVGARRAEAAYPGDNGWIVFHAGQQLWAMPSDGSAAPTALTTLGAGPGTGLAADPVFSPDGTQIAFSFDRTDDPLPESFIYIGDFDPSGPSLTFDVNSPVTNGTADTEPTWSPDGATLAFVRTIRYGPPTIGTATSADPAGTTLTDTTKDFNALGVLPGMRVTNLADESWGLVETVGATSLTMTPLLFGTENDWDIGDGYEVQNVQGRIFTVAANALNSIGTQESAGGAADIYTDDSPAWAPDNSAIAFETNRNGNFDVFTMGISGGSETNRTGVALLSNHAQAPSWSPDGSQIVFEAERDMAPFTRDIWVMTAAGTGHAALTTDLGQERWPAFSPDGSSIAFVNGSPGTVHTMPAAGGAGTEVRAAPPADHQEPDWQPVLGSVDDAYAVANGGTLNVAAPGVLDNDGALSSSLGARTAVLDTDVSNGTLTLNADGSFTYTHDGSNTASDSFTYHPAQGGAVGPEATVTITIGNAAPVAVNDGPYNVTEGSSVTVPAPGVLGNDTDLNTGDVLTAVKVSDPAHGTVTLNPNGSFTYTHDGSDTTSDSFTYQASDGTDVSNVATVSLTVSDAGSWVGLVNPAQGFWTLYRTNGSTLTSFFYGNPGDFPVMGDWNCDGVDTPGMYRQSDGFVYLRNSNSQGIADIRFFFGNPGDVPIVGDFDADGCDTVSIYRPAEGRFYIINELGANNGGLGPADFSYLFGNPGDKPFVGDFDGDGDDTVGLHRESTGFVYFRQTHTEGVADSQFFFGDPGDRLVAGDWGVINGVDTPAIYRPTTVTFYFRHTNTQGTADSTLTVGQSSWLPVAGVFE